MSDIKSIALYYRGTEVKKLQEKLVGLGYSIPEWEIKQSTFGKGTKQALVDFQQTVSLSTTGILDESTNTSLEKAIKSQEESGKIDDEVNTSEEEEKLSSEDETSEVANEEQEDAEQTISSSADDSDKTDSSSKYKIEGRLHFSDGQNPSGVVVRVYSRSFQSDDLLLAEATTDDLGCFVFTYDPPDGLLNLDIRVIDENGDEIEISKTKQNASSEEVINLIVPETVRRPESEYFRLTSDISKYNSDSTVLASISESKNSPDISLLHSASGWDARLIALNSLAEKNSADTNLSKEVLYGLYRVGLPQTNELLAKVDLDVFSEALKKANNAGIVNLFKKDVAKAKEQFTEFARSVRITEKNSGALSSISELLDRTLISSEEESDKRDYFIDCFFSSLNTGIDLWEQIQNSGKYSVYEIDELKLQGKLSYLTGNNAEVANSFRPTDSLVPLNSIDELVDNGFHKASRWVSHLEDILAHDTNLTMENLIPPSYLGDDIEQRLENYSQDLARMVSNSFQTNVVAEKIQNDGIISFEENNENLKLNVATFLKNRKVTTIDSTTEVKFDIAIHLVDDFVDDDEPETISAVKKLQRLYQTTPNDESMALLWEAGFESASDIAKIPRSQFIKAYGPQNTTGLKFQTLEEAILVHAKAQQIHSVAFSALSAVRQFAGSPMPYVLKPSEDVYPYSRDYIISRYPSLETAIPNMETLFGSIDFCQCRHCRSVLSPAAYLVDLLEFIDSKSATWSSFETIWANTHGGQEYTEIYSVPYNELCLRRPDIPNLALSCENTHTAMPYIDIVNEILECLVIDNEPPLNLPAYDTGDYDSEDLIAEPQNILPGAYKILRETCYPLNLPFDLWTEMMRRFSEHFKIPFWKVLDRFCLVEDLNPEYSASVLAATDGESVDLTGNAPSSIDGVTLAANDLVLLKDQNDAVQNGIYAFTGTESPLTRASNYNSPTDISGLIVYVRKGTRNLGTYWKVPEDGEVIVGEAESEFSITYGLQAVFNEYLGFTKDEVGLLTSPDFSNDKVNELYGNPISDLTKGKNLARSLGITYLELADIVDTAFVNPMVHSLKVLDALEEFEDYKIDLDEAMECVNEFSNCYSDFYGHLTNLHGVIDGFNADDWIDDFKATLVLASDSTSPCDFGQTILCYVDVDGEENHIAAEQTDLLKINLFVRLWKKLGWTIEETDRALTALLPGGLLLDSENLYANIGQALNSVLIYLAHAKNIEERLKIRKDRRLKILTLWSDISTKIHTRLYEKLFLRSGVAGLNSVFDHPLGDFLNQSPSELIKNHIAHLQGALSLTPEEVELILEANGLELDSALLTMENVSILHRHGLLAQGLRLTVEDILALIELTGINPFDSINTGALQSIENDGPYKTVLFIDIAEKIAESEFSIEDLQYLLQHDFDPVGQYRLEPATLLGLIKNLREGIERIEKENALPDAEDISNEYFLEKLQLAFTPEVAARFMKYWAATTEFEASKSEVVEGDQLPAEYFEQEPDIRVDWDSEARKQYLVFKGALTDEMKRDLTDSTDTPELLVELLDEIQLQSRNFPIDEWDGAVEYLVSKDISQESNYELIDPEDFEDITYLELWDDGIGIQYLRFQGVVTDEQKEKLINLASTAGSQNLLLELLNEVQGKHASLKGETGEFEQFYEDYLITSSFPKDAFLGLFQPGVSGQAFAIDGKTESDRRLVFVELILIYIKQKLIRQFIIETLSTNLSVDTGRMDYLLMDDQLVSNPIETDEPLVTAFSSADEAGVTATYMDSTDSSLEIRIEETLEIGNVPDGAVQAELEGYFEVPEDGEYRFSATPDSTTFVTLQISDLEEPMFETADGSELETLDTDWELKTGVLYHIAFTADSIDGQTPVGKVKLNVQGEKGTRNNLILYPEKMVESTERAYLLVKKILQLMTGLGLNEREIKYYGNYWEAFGEGGYNFLPTLESDASPVDNFNRFYQLLNYSILQKEMAGGNDDLMDFLELGTTDYQAEMFEDGLGLVEALSEILAEITRHDAGTISNTIQYLYSSASEDVAPEKALFRIREILTIVKRSHLSFDNVSKWATPIPDFDMALDARNALRANYGDEQWRLVSKSIFDKLRQAQRDAMVSYLVNKTAGIDTQEQLYEYLLVDPGMEPVVQTSRLRLAISSVQLFIQRCLLNLEPSVHPSAIDMDIWQWMKRYRVWEANRKILLFPENWLEPEFRDDKTHLFQELESTLLQGDITNDMAEDAFFNYLNGLEEIARLDIVTMYCEEKGSPDSDIFHVVGRSFSLPYKYYYRRYSSGMWTPWEPIPAEIKGDHLVAAVWRERLNLFWLTILEKPGKAKDSAVVKLVEIKHADSLSVKIEVDEDTTINAGAGLISPEKIEEALKTGDEESIYGSAKTSDRYRTYEIQLNWCEYFQGQWKPQQTGGMKNVISLYTDQIFDMSLLNVYVYKEYKEGEEVGLRINLGEPFEQSFRIISRNSVPEIRNTISFQDMPYYKDEDKLIVQYPGSIQESQKEGEWPTANLGATNEILDNCSNISIRPCCNTVLQPSMSTAKFAAPFFIQDDHHTLFARPEKIDLPVNYWDGWAVHELNTPVSGKLAIGENLNVIAAKPDLLIKARDTELIATNALAAEVPDIELKMDWLLNSETVLKFGDTFIGETGRLEIEEIAADSVEEDATNLVKVHTGSELAKDSRLIISSSEESISAKGLTIVGEGGANHAAVNTINTKVSTDFE